MMPVIIDTRVPRHTGLNRTFYGIETKVASPREANEKVLIVPFMELKLDRVQLLSMQQLGLNRTFYGIETLGITLSSGTLIVLIVPFMELKLFLRQRIT